jgi:1-acyl-sn-glycerol-3-phosphate acyltransferase
MTARFLRWCFDKLMATLTRREIEGLENVPPEGPYIMASNHLGLVDVPVIFGLVGGEHLTGWAAEKWQRHIIFGTLLRMGGGIFIQRGEVDRKALEGAIRWLEAGNVFGMAPEGTRSKTGGLMRGKTGIAYLVDHVHVPILPVALTGTEKAMRSMLRLRRQRVTVRFGRLFDLLPLEAEDRSASLRRNTDEVMCHIAALLPPEYRGIYADHPRTLELLRASET